LGLNQGQRPVGPPGARPMAPEVVWHDLECGSYRADLPLWRDLAARNPGPILDVGAGAGRVALELAQAGHEVTALDRDPVLLDALGARAAGMAVHTVRADARSFELEQRDFALCLVPMQTIHLLDGAGERGAFLTRARAHLRPSGLLACAILADFELFDRAAGDPVPTPERACVDGVLYASHPMRVAVRGRRVVVERERRILAAPAAPAARPAGHADPPADQIGECERDVVELELISTSELEREGRLAGFAPRPAVEIPPTEDHVGSVVVLLGA
jgi:SAM-dependent methyltransferase